MPFRLSLVGSELPLEKILLRGHDILTPVTSSNGSATVTAPSGGLPSGLEAAFKQMVPFYNASANVSTGLSTPSTNGTTPSGKSSSSHTGAIVGGVVGGVVALLAVGAIAFFVMRRQRRKRSQSLQKQGYASDSSAKNGGDAEQHWLQNEPNNPELDASTPLNSDKKDHYHPAVGGQTVELGTYHQAHEMDSVERQENRGGGVSELPG